MGAAVLRADRADDALRDVLNTVVRIVDGCEAASISRYSAGAFSTVAATSDLAVELDRAQYTAGEGPCVDAVTLQTVATTSDRRRDERWANLLRRSSGAPLPSVLSCGVRVGAIDPPFESINCYGARRGGVSFSDEATKTLVLVCSHVGALLALSRTRVSRAQTVDDLRQVLETREVIAQAQGIVMERYQLSSAGAFDVLRRSSQRLGGELRDVAERVISTGDIDLGT